MTSSLHSLNSQSSVLTQEYVPEGSRVMPCEENEMIAGAGVDSEDRSPEGPEDGDVPDCGPGHHEGSALPEGSGNPDGSAHCEGSGLGEGHHEGSARFEGSGGLDVSARPGLGEGHPEGSARSEGSGSLDVSARCEGSGLREGCEHSAGEEGGGPADGEAASLCVGSAHHGGEERGEEPPTVVPRPCADTCSAENDSYVVPPAWNAVLQVWNDPAIGAGLPEAWPAEGLSGLSRPVAETTAESGEGRPVDGGDADVGGELSDGEHTQPGQEHAATSRATEQASEPGSASHRGGGLKQSDLKAWQK